jgi:hypothetical protein
LSPRQPNRTQIRWIYLLLYCATFSGAQVTQPTATLTGRVLNAVTRQPIARVLVQAGNSATLTDYQGRFQLDQVADGTIIQTTKPGYSPASPESSITAFNINKLQSSLDLKLYPNAIVTARLLSPTGEPLQGVFTTAERAIFTGPTRRWMAVATAQTDTHGDLRLPLPGGHYRIKTQYLSPHQDQTLAVLPQYFTDETSSQTSKVIHVRSGEEKHFDLHPDLLPTHSVTIKSDTFQRGSPNIIAHSSQGLSIPMQTRRSRNPGEVILSLPTGRYDLTAHLQTTTGPQIAQASVTITGRDIDDLTLHFTPIPEIPVELIVDKSLTSDNTTSTPTLQQFGLFLTNEQDESDSNEAMIGLSNQKDRAPSFTAPPSTYRLRAGGVSPWYVKSATYGLSDLLADPIEVVTGTGQTPIRIAISNDTGTLQGTTTLSSKPAAAWIYLIATTPTLSSVTTIRSTDNGTFQRPFLPPGTYRVLASEQSISVDFNNPTALEAFSSKTQTITITPGATSNANLEAFTTEELAQ